MNPPDYAADFWNSRYAETGFAYGTAPNDFLREQTHRLAPDSRILSLAEGEGRNAVALAALGHRVTAVDGAEAGLAKARALAASARVPLDTVVADLARYEPAGPYDAVIAIFAHLPPPVRRLAHARAWAALRPGGLFILESYAPGQLARGTGGPKQADMMPPLADLLADFPGATPLLAETCVRPVLEGRFHTGDSEVNRLVLRAPAPHHH